MYFIIGFIFISIISFFAIFLRLYPKEVTGHDKLIINAIEIISVTGLYFTILHFSTNTNISSAIFATLVTFGVLFWRIRLLLKLIPKQNS